MLFLCILERRCKHLLVVLGLLVIWVLLLVFTIITLAVIEDETWLVVLAVCLETAA